MIYVHVPFCKSFCTYCDFYSELCARGGRQQVQNALYDAWTEAVCREAGARRDEIVRSCVAGPDTLYMGGGTPSVIPISCLGKVAEALGAHPGRFEEFTVEVNPDDIVRGGEQYVKGLLAMGVNRVSMGVQSFDDAMLRWMNRRHSAAQAVEAYELLRRSGVENVSIDLIFGISHLDDQCWRETLRRAVDLHPEHISAYQLSIEEGSALAGMVQDGRYVEAGEDQCRRQYSLLCEHLRAAGYHHYEISNWALPGREAVHNSAYWRRCPYVGLGPAAHSLEMCTDGTQRRSWHPSDLDAYIADPLAMEHETLGAEEIAAENVMLPLRTDAGVPLAMLGDARAAEALLAAGALERVAPGGNVRIPEDHFFVADSIISELM